MERVNVGGLSTSHVIGRGGQCLIYHLMNTTQKHFHLCELPLEIILMFI